MDTLPSDVVSDTAEIEDAAHDTDPLEDSSDPDTPDSHSPDRQGEVDLVDLDESEPDLGDGGERDEASDRDHSEPDLAEIGDLDGTDGDLADSTPDRADVDDPDVDPPPECPARPEIDRSEPWVTIGFGERGYRELTPCQEVPLEFGMQGTFHVFGAVRAGNLDVGEEAVWMDFSVEHDGEEPVLAASTYPDTLDNIDGQLEYSGAPVAFYVGSEELPSGLVRLQVRVHNMPGSEYPEFSAQDYAYVRPCFCDAEGTEPQCLDEESPFYVAPERPEDELCPGG